MRLIPLVLLLALSCLPCSPARAAEPPVVVASVEPVAMVLRELYGDQACVVTLLAPNQNPHNPMLSPKQVLTLREARLVVWLGPQADPAVASLIAQRSGPSLALTAIAGVAVQQGDPDEHDEAHPGDVDPHLWLDPDNMAALARALASRDDVTLAEGQPAAFLERLEKAERTIQEELDPLRDTPWLTYHQPWAYYQRRFGLADPIIVSQQLGVGPGSRQFVALAERIQADQVRCAIVEPEAQAGIMARLCPDCRQISLDPLGRDHADARYEDWLRGTITATFRQCLAGVPDP